MLKPFSAGAPEIAISGAVGRYSNSISLTCALSGSLADIVIPPAAAPPRRRDRLWEGTCLELFLGPKNSERYWEFNLSPSGDWNVYRFSSYRSGMKEERAFRALPFSVEAAMDEVRFSLQFGGGPITLSDELLEAAVTAVIRDARGGMSYWALIQSGPEPDFHQRDSFIIEL